MTDTNSDSPAPPFCVTFTSDEVHQTAYDGNAGCTAPQGQWDSSWTKYIEKFCDTWLKSAVHDDEWLRVTPLWWNKSCDCSASQQDTFLARQSGRCSDPFTYQLTKYLMFTKYKKIGAKDKYRMLVFFKAWASEYPNASLQNNKRGTLTLLHTCSSESKGISYALLGNPSEGISDLCPPLWTDSIKSANPSTYLLCMGDGQAVDAFYRTNATPETMRNRVARMDYIDHGISPVDPPLHKALSRSFYYNFGIAFFIVIIALIAFKVQGKRKV